MAIAGWQDLCIDALDVERQSAFWAAATGLAVVGPLDHRRLEGPTPRHRVWVNRVDRPHVVKNRVHLDVHVASVDDLVALGATVLSPAAETGRPWTVVADPEGNELCAFVREPERLPSYRLHGIGIDCIDPERQARWWGELLGVAPTHESGDAGDDWWTITGAGPDATLTLDFAAVPEARTMPNRVHWDVVADLDKVLAAGATHLWDTPSWTVLADPEGNEFCVFPPD